jgi:hypothetical protein
MPESVDEIARTLRLLQLRPLTRPSIGPDEPLTLDLVQFDLTAYAYSAIAYIRNLLDGLLVLWAANNVAAVDLVTRGLYEWTMHAAYVGQRIRIPIKAADFVECRSIMDRIQSGNGWLKRHGENTGNLPSKMRFLTAYELST